MNAFVTIVTEIMQCDFFSARYNTVVGLRQFSIAVALPARAERPLKICSGGHDGSQKQCTLRPRGQSDRNGKLPLKTEELIFGGTYIWNGVNISNKMSLYIQGAYNRRFLVNKQCVLRHYLGLLLVALQQQRIEEVKSLTSELKTTKINLERRY